LKSRRNILAPLTLLALMGCQQSDTVVHTEAPAAVPPTAAIPFTMPAGDDHPAAQNATLPTLSLNPLPLLSIRTPTVWTAQSLALEVLPGSPLPVRAVVEQAPPPAEPIVVAPQPRTSTARPATAPAPVTTAVAAPAPAPVPTSVPTSVPTPAPAPVVPAAVTVVAAPSAAADIAARTNNVRAGRGLAPLARDGSLDGAAAGWARELATSGVLRHSGLPQQLLGKPWSTLGENVGFGSSSAIIHDALVNSAGHLANIVGTNFTRIGVGAATDVNGRLWVVQLFGG
jgi:uncharacterized protein YkwD